jgi:hypothetical protein
MSFLFPVFCFGTAFLEAQSMVDANRIPFLNDFLGARD